MGQTCSACDRNKNSFRGDMDSLMQDDGNVNRDRGSEDEGSVSATTTDNLVRKRTNDWCKAVETDNVEQCKSLLSAHPDLDLQDAMIDREKGERALHIAVRNRNTALVELLCNSEADVNTQSRVSLETPLHLAAAMNDVELIELLLYFGANTEIGRKDGTWAVDICRSNIRSYFTKESIEKIKSLPYPPTVKSLSNSTSNQDIEQIREKRNEIRERGDTFITIFGQSVGCEVDEIALCCQRLDISKKQQIWNKILPNVESTQNIKDITKLLMILTAAALKIRNKKNGASVKPNAKQVAILSSFVKEKLPEKNGQRILTERDFVEKMHLWLMEIHDDEDWVDQHV